MASIEIILNRASGDDDKKEAENVLSQIFGPAARIDHVNEREDFSESVRHLVANDAEIIVAGGGDGTVSAVASAIANTEMRLGVLPLGTLNHFARDLSIPLEIEQAAKVILGGEIKQIDAAEVNGRLFINNSSLGLYPEVVHGRELRERLGHGKWSALLRSAIRVFRLYPLFAVRIDSGGEQIVTRTPFVFIGNNEYEIEGLNIGERRFLDKRKLAVYTTRRTGRLALLRIALRALFGLMRQERDFVTFLTDEVTIETPLRFVRIAMDGEVAMIETPLRYRILPGALRVIVPAAGPDKEVG